MRSNYKKLGPYIRVVDERNKKLEVETLLGVSVQKIFIPSIANTVGTDFKKYKIVRKHQFTYIPDTSRRGDKIGLAMLEDQDEALVSQAYTVFEVIDHNELDPEYLMMWFRRPEFDRYARFKSHGSVREIFDWEEMCDVELPIPSIEKQRAIVAEYNTVVNRIQLNEKLNEKLEETAQAIYKQWFVDFEFPNDLATPVDIEALEMPNGGAIDFSKGYKSSGGKMVYNEELDKEIPEGWEVLSIQDLIDQEVIFKNQDGNHGELHPKSSDYVEDGVPFVMANDLEFGTINFVNCKRITEEQSKKLRIKPAVSEDVLLTHKATMGRVAIVPDEIENIVLTPQVTYYRSRNKQRISKEFLYCLFNSMRFQQELIGESEQSTRNFLSITNQRSLKVLLPSGKRISDFTQMVSSVLKPKEILYKESTCLNNLSSLLLSKMTKVEETTEKEMI